MGTDLAEVGRKVTDIPGLIERKFQEQSVQITERGKTAGDTSRARWNLIVSGLAAIGGLVAAASWIIEVWVKH